MQLIASRSSSSRSENGTCLLVVIQNHRVYLGAMPEVDHGVLGQLQTIVHSQRLDSPTDIETLELI